jgi:hypothetical protein
MAKQKKYHYIYKTACSVTGKFYVGMHSTDELEDGYLGSGKILGYSRRKHGDENHTKEILEYCSSRVELKQREKQIINDELLSDSLNINLKYGGEGGWDHIKSSPHYQEQQALAGKNGGFKNRNLMSATAIQNTLAGNRKGGKNSKIQQNRCDWTGRTHKEETKIQIGTTVSKHQTGQGNSQFGTCWVTDGIKPVKIKKEQLDEFLAKGFIRGRKHTEDRLHGA